MTVIFIIALILYVFYGIFCTDVFTLAPMFLAIVLICLFCILKQGVSELHTVHELLKKENNEDEEEDSVSESTDESIK